MKERLKFLKDLDDFFLNDIVDLVENKNKIMVSIGSQLPFKDLTNNQKLEIKKVFKELGIKMYSTRPFVIPGQHDGLTNFGNLKNFKKLSVRMRNF